MAIEKIGQKREISFVLWVRRETKFVFFLHYCFGMATKSHLTQILQSFRASCLDAKPTIYRLCRRSGDKIDALIKTRYLETNFNVKHCRLKVKKRLHTVQSGKKERLTFNIPAWPQNGYEMNSNQSNIARIVSFFSIVPIFYQIWLGEWGTFSAKFSTISQ